MKADDLTLLRSEFNRLAEAKGCSPARPLKNGDLFERGRGKALFSVYYSSTEKDGQIKVAIAETEKTPNISTMYQYAAPDVETWVRTLQAEFGAVKSRPPHKYPRIKISSIEAGFALIAELNAFFVEKVERPAVDVPQSSESPEGVDKRTLASILTRRGQARFRKTLMYAYGATCAITGCAAAEVLEAAHIIPFAGDQNYAISNGLLLRADVHTLFDLNLISINPGSMIVRVAPFLCEPYAQLDGSKVRLPERVAFSPSKERLRAHYKRWVARTANKANSADATSRAAD